MSTAALASANSLAGAERPADSEAKSPGLLAIPGIRVSSKFGRFDVSTFSPIENGRDPLLPASAARILAAGRIVR
jgi:hypothetical protein